ncbi:2-dehydropantoate 2-reductase [Conexibacter stalactiti]|uniref:2-dehydropantoate 2-reductase n=1 Tax=Conexibacter stalactiti TaxID=1940611 RepID=A0ABU4HPM8_9ACTN|nr:2-dehydropantoate 2-reductase [Conexibacter stalactiti]MDW5594515.1 2-dehydropantoate 2-reductase [Conexibacter stalactiti]MEC5035157.1 2-dehydropantoate 2-reductase [Conexibacter stalactiti]
MTTGPRIAVLGSGANGASIGADLTAAGHDVTLIEQWPEHVRAMRADGLRIELPDETLHVRVKAHDLCDVATFTRPFDVVLLLMKAYDARWATQLIAPHLAPGGLVAGVQNGMTADVIAEVVGAERTLGTVIEVSSMMTVPGVVERHSPPSRSWFAVGALDPATRGREHEVADLLRCSGAVEVVDDIRAAKWMKLVSNCTTLVTTALLGVPMRAALNEPGMRELMIRCGQEALDTGAALGHPVLPIFGLREEHVRRPEEVVETLLDVLYAGFVLEHTTTTILHDWRKGRHSEVDDINGLVVAEAERLGGAAPANAAVVALAHQVERGELEPGPGNLARLLAAL